MNDEIITAPAAQVTQGKLKLFATSLKVKTLLKQNFYSVEQLDPENPDESGYQRLLNKARAKKLAVYILDGQNEKDAFLPTSVFLATDKSIAHDKNTNTISFRLKDVGPFSVVDGQHRLEGLRMAAELAEKNSENYPKALDRILDFEVPVNIAIELKRIPQMSHFLIVNTTQKTVDKAVEQRIYARLTQLVDVEDIPTLPKWIKKIVEKGEEDKALKMVVYLNENEPWKDKIRMANDQSTKGKTIKQDSFVKAIVKNVLTAGHPLIEDDRIDFEKQKIVFLNYWKAIASILDDGSNSVLYKYNGVGIFCKFSLRFFDKLQTEDSNKCYKIGTMYSHLKRCFENMEIEDGEYALIGHSDWWKPGGRASSMNNAAINGIVSQMCRALNRRDQSANENIEL